jgi:hypothetical protein
MNPIPFQSAQHARERARPSRTAQAVMPAGDVRWVLAARASLAAGASAQTAPHDRERLTAWAGRLGITPIHAAAIISIAEQAAARGGLDASAADQIAALPAPDPRRPADRLGRWLWTSIVVLGVVAGALALLRFG